MRITRRTMTSDELVADEREQRRGERLDDADEQSADDGPP